MSKHPPATKKFWIRTINLSVLCMPWAKVIVYKDSSPRWPALLRKQHCVVDTRAGTLRNHYDLDQERQSSGRRPQLPLQYKPPLGKPPQVQSTYISVWITIWTSSKRLNNYCSTWFQYEFSPAMIFKDRWSSEEIWAIGKLPKYKRILNCEDGPWLSEKYRMLKRNLKTYWLAQGSL